MTQLPLGIKQALESGDCVLFIGAGIATHLSNQAGVHAPTAKELAVELSNQFSLGTDAQDLAKVAEVVEIRKGRQALDDFLRKRFSNLEPDRDLKWISTVKWKAIFTTNYDLGIERTYELNGSPLQKPISISISSEFIAHDARFEVPVYHLHGTLFGGNNQVVITKADYDHFKEHRRMLFEVLKQEFATSNILYIGYANEDQNWNLMLSEISSEFYPTPLPQSYRVSPATDPLDIEILKAKNVETIDLDYATFAQLAQIALSETVVDPDRLRRLGSTVPSHLADAFEKHPAGVLRLLSSWVYVNQAPFNDPPNTENFLEGDRPNWALIAKNHHFKRDIEEELYDDVLDYWTGAANKPGIVTLLGPAGYGITTILMSLAVKLVQEGVKPVFMHRIGTSLIEGDMEFATTLFAEPPIFVIDDCADNSDQIQSAIAQLRETKKPAFVFLGERVNEWRDTRSRLGGKEYLVEPLSDVEINALLDCLTQHGALHNLEHMARDIQFAVIKEKHSKELLVAMKEATEGMGFDAILESEYQGIPSVLGKTVYLTVCCFYQQGTYIRDALLAKILDIDLSRLYEETEGVLDGVVLYDELDEARGIFGARARHRTIATIIWERCGGIAERGRLLQLAIENINLVYAMDRIVFEKFVRTDRLVDSIRGLEGKIQFFDTACKKEPSNPYVRQHYARMLSREGKAELALSQIDEAIKLVGRFPVRSLFHTKGKILEQLALTIESEDIARKRLLQSEECFRKSIAMNAKDEYGYQGLAQLYIGWAKRAQSEADSANYITKAEEVISEGLKRVRVRDGLWIASSEIEKWLGDTPNRVKALEKAVLDSPGSIVARYLLGTVYRRMGTPDKALAMLEPNIKGHPDEFRSFIEYSLALLDLKRPILEAIATLRISTTYGLADPRYIATLGGLLFLNNSFEDAAKVFQESTKREFSLADLHTTYFRPSMSNIKCDLEGKVIAAKPSYSLIEVEGFPNFLCPTSKSGGKRLRRNLRVKFSIEFSAKGPVADRPTIL